MWREPYGLWRVTSLILRRFSAQKHDTDKKIPVNDCGIFYIQNIFVRVCIRYKSVFMAVVFSLILSVIFVKSTYCPHILQNLKMLNILTLKCLSSPNCTLNHLSVNTLNAELNPICCLLALLEAHHFLHVSRIRVKSLTLRLLMSYIYIWSTYSWCF